jgi:hypothetical protein
MARMDRERYRALRLGNLRGLFLWRWGRPLPDDDCGREDIEELLCPISLGPNPDEGMALAIQDWAPWLPHDEACSLTAHVKNLPRKVRMPSARVIGQRQRLTLAERETLGLWTMTPFDMTEADIAGLRKAKERARQQRKRAVAGAASRAVYIAKSLSRLKPWEAEGVSRRTWYRRRGTSLSEVKSICTPDAVVPRACDLSQRRRASNGMQHPRAVSPSDGNTFEDGLSRPDEVRTDLCQGGSDE